MYNSISNCSFHMEEDLRDCLVAIISPLPLMSMVPMCFVAKRLHEDTELPTQSSEIRAVS
jgi:hypothetical protein